MLARLDRLLATASNLITIAAFLAGGAIVSALFAWAAWATKELAVYAPLSWVFAAILGLLIFSLLCLLVAKARGIFIQSSLQRMYYETGDRLNPLASQFNGQRIKIADLISPVHSSIEGRTFIDCEIIGPANIALFASAPNKGTLTHCSFTGSAGVITKNNIFIPTGIGFVDCNFLRCKFYNVLLLVPEAGIDNVLQGIEGLPWITSAFKEV